MSFMINQTHYDNSNFQNFNEIKQNNESISPFNTIPDELISKIFSYFTIPTLGSACCVSKKWNSMGNDSFLWKKLIYRELAFGKNKWAQNFGQDVVKDEDKRRDFESLPWQAYIEDCRKFKSLFPNKSATDSLRLIWLPKTLNGQLSLKNIAKLIEKDFIKSDVNRLFIHAEVNNKFGDETIDQSYWIIMTKDVVTTSIDKSYEEQTKILNQLSKTSLINYQTPRILEALISIFLNCFAKSKIEPLNTTAPRSCLCCPARSLPLRSFTNCVETIGSYQITVGQTNFMNLDITMSLYLLPCIGIMGVHRFRDTNSG